MMSTEETMKLALKMAGFKQIPADTAIHVEGRSITKTLRCLSPALCLSSRLILQKNICWIVKSSREEYDVIIIGAGIGGLTCAAALVKGGKKVFICEQHSKPGGYVTSYTRKGFVFDGGTQSFSYSNIFFPILKDLGIWDKIKFAKVNYQIITPDINLRLDSIPTLISELKKLFPEESYGIETYFRNIYGIIKDFEKVTPAFMDIVFSPKIWKKILFYLKFPLLHLSFLAKMIRFRKTTSKDLVEKCIANEKLRFLLSSPSSLFGEALGWSIFLDNWWPIGGMQEFANCFVEIIEKGGGKLSLGTKVEKILIENGEAVGVRLEDGREIYSDFVVSNVDYKQTFLKLIDSKHLEQTFIEKVEKTRVSGSVFSVYLGVNIDVKELRKYVWAQHVVCRLFYEKKNISDPEFYRYCPEIWICVPSLADESLAPTGKSVVILQAPASYNYMNKWQTDNGKRTKAYKELKQKVANELITIAEKIIPDLSRHIVVRDEATPLTMERYTLNTNGATTGWGEAFYKGFFSGSIRTPIENLFTVGHWSFSIGGVPTAMLTGKKAAEAILEKA